MNFSVTRGEDWRIVELVDDATDAVIPLTGLRPNEVAYCLMAAAINPESYDGRSSSNNLIGEVSDLREGPGRGWVLSSFPYYPIRLATEASLTTNTPLKGDLIDLLVVIQTLTAEPPYDDDPYAALELAAEVLNVNPPAEDRRWLEHRLTEEPFGAHTLDAYRHAQERDWSYPPTMVPTALEPDTLRQRY